MPGFNGTGPMGMGPITGGGRGFCGIRGAGIAHPAYGFHHGGTYAFPEVYGYTPFNAQMSREQELELLRNEATALKRELETIEGRIGQLSADTK
jgi:hypothetical protein